jgi:hypothetical protein
MAPRGGKRKLREIPAALRTGEVAGTLTDGEGHDGGWREAGNLSWMGSPMVFLETNSGRMVCWACFHKIKITPFKICNKLLYKKGAEFQ